MSAILFNTLILFTNLFALINAVYQPSTSNIASSSIFQLINADGICKGENQIHTFIETKTDTDTELKLCNILDCTGESDVNVINQVFNTNLVPNNGKHCAFCRFTI